MKFQIVVDAERRDMEAEQPATQTRTAVWLYEISQEGSVGEPRLIPARECMGTVDISNAPELMILYGPLWSPAAGARAIDLGAQQSTRALKIAVLHLPDAGLGARRHAELQELLFAFDSVFAVDPAIGADLVRRLVRAIALPESQTRVIGCDWNDVRSMFGHASNICFAGYGFGNGMGAERALQAVTAAVGQTSRQGFCLSAACGVCVAIVAASAGLLGGEVRAVVDHVRSMLGAFASIALHIEFDDTMEEGAMEVDIFSFGASGPGFPALPDAFPRCGESLASVCFGTETCNENALYSLARTTVLREQRASISLVQRNLRVGYMQASRLLDAMEGDILSPKDGKGMRTIICDATTSHRPSYPPPFAREELLPSERME